MKTVQIKGADRHLAVGKIICIGRNYAEHAKEMKSAVPTTPVFFLKPATAIVYDTGSVVLPSISHDVHHEVELTVLIGKDGSHIAEQEARQYVAGYGVGLDMTLRDVQEDAKQKGLPWTLAKGFDTSAPISDFVQAEHIGNPQALVLNLTVNGSVRQHASTGDMIFSIEKLIAYISQFISLEQGDVLYTGTPHGVSQVHAGDFLQATLSDPTGTTLTSVSVYIR